MYQIFNSFFIIFIYFLDTLRIKVNLTQHKIEKKEKKNKIYNLQQEITSRK